MNVSLRPEIAKRVNQRVKSGKFASPEEVVTAAILALDQQEQLGEFEPGELNRLLAEGEENIEKHGALDGERAYINRRARRRKRVR